MKRILRGKFVEIKQFISNLLKCFNYELIVNLKGYEIRKRYKRSTMFVKKNLGKDLVVAEVGVWKGVNAEEMLNQLPIKKIYLIDSWNILDEKPNMEFVVDLVSEEEMKQAEKSARKRLSKFKESIIIKKESKAAVKEIKDELDFVYLDIFGRRRDENIKKEIEMYYNLLKVGGIIGGHDIDNGSSGSFKNGVPNAVSRFVVENDLDLFIQEDDWWCVKK